LHATKPKVFIYVKRKKQRLNEASTTLFSVYYELFRHTKYVGPNIIADRTRDGQ